MQFHTSYSVLATRMASLSLQGYILVLLIGRFLYPIFSMHCQLFGWVLSVLDSFVECLLCWDLGCADPRIHLMCRIPGSGSSIVPFSCLVFTESVSL
jgi:hypothetical protein